MKNVRDSGLSRKRDENAGSGPPLPDPDCSTNFKPFYSGTLLLNSQKTGKGRMIILIFSAVSHVNRTDRKKLWMHISFAQKRSAFVFVGISLQTGKN